jgi:hypothetical protein
MVPDFQIPGGRLPGLGGRLAAANWADLSGPPFVRMRVKMQLRGTLPVPPLITIS